MTWTWRLAHCSMMSIQAWFVRPWIQCKGERGLTGPPVKGDFLPLQASTQAGIRIEVAVVPVCPPPSPPCLSAGNPIPYPINPAYLSTDDIHTNSKSLRDMFRCTNHLNSQHHIPSYPMGGTHIHTQNPSFVEFLNNFFRRNTDRTNKQFSLLLDNNID